MVTGNPWADEAAEQSAKPRTAAGRPTAVDGECQSGIAGIVGVRSGFALLGQLVPGAAGLVHDRLCPGAERIPLLARVLARIFQRLLGLLARFPGFFHGFVPGLAAALHAGIHHLASLHVGLIGQLNRLLPSLLGFGLRCGHHVLGAFAGFLGSILDSLLGLFDLVSIVATIVATIVLGLAGRQQKCRGKRRQQRSHQIAHLVILLKNFGP